tara:strand:- start:26582 stop:27343 length:762 start_codon:yes stop_codon:yes gene_type:complete
MSEYSDKQAEIYDIVHGGKSYQSEVDYIINIAESNNVTTKKVLDVGCGTGMHMEGFQSRGWETQGVDISDNMLSIARSRLEEGTVLEEDLDKIEDKFDLAVSMFNVINHIGGRYENLEDFFRGISSKMNKNGILVFDCFNHDAFIRESPEVTTKKLDNGFELRTIPMASPFDSRLVLNCTYTNNMGEDHDYQIEHKIWHTGQIFASLFKQGFALVGLYDHFEQYNHIQSGKYESKDETKYKIVVVAKKVRRHR